MATNIEPDFNETRRNIANINTGRSPMDALGAAAQLYSMMKQGERQDMVQSHKAVSATLETLNYAQSDTNLIAEDLEPIEGINANEDGTINLFDYNYQLALNAVKSLENTSNFGLSSEEKELNKLVIADAKRKLAYQDTQKDLRNSSLDKLELLAAEYIHKTKSDPSFTNKIDLESANQIFKDITTGYDFLNKEFGKTIPAEHENLYQEMKELNELNMKSIALDVDRDLKGIQVKLDEASPYAIDFLEKRGLKETGVEGDIATYNLDSVIDPNDPEASRNRILSSSELRSDENLYKDAIQSFSQYEEAIKGMESKDIELKNRAPELAVFDVVENWVADPTKSTMAFMVGQAVWSGEDITNSPLFTRLGEVEQKELIFAINELKDRQFDGGFVAEGDKLQSLINAGLKRALSGGQKDAIQMSEGLAANIHRSNTDLNSKIVQYNNEFIATEGKDIPKLPVIAGDANLQTIDQNKEQHVNILQSMLEKEKTGEWWFQDTAISADPTDILKQLMDDRDAPMESKDKLMKLLIDEFLHTDGSPDRYKDVSDMFDGYTPRMEIFYETLKSYRYLNLASPTLSLIDQIGS